MTDHELADRLAALARCAPVDALERAAVELLVSAERTRDERYAVPESRVERLVRALEERSRQW